jgi:hypothetical protein
MASLKFPYKKLPANPIESHPERKSILRPVIPICLINGDKKQRYESLIDSGADYCIFHSVIGEIIGLDVKSGPVMKFMGTGNEPQSAYFHNIIIEIGGWKYHCYVGFSYDIESLPYGILGQNGFFNLFTIFFDIAKERIELIKLK